MNKRNIISLVVFLSVVLLGISFITPYWSSSTLGTTTEFNILNDLGVLSISSEINYDVGMTANYTSIAVFSLLSLYVILHLLDSKNRLKWVKITVSGLTIVAAVLVIVLGLVFINDFNETVGRIRSMSMAIGLILSIIGGLVGGVFGLVGSLGKSKK